MIASLLNRGTIVAKGTRIGCTITHTVRGRVIDIRCNDGSRMVMRRLSALVGVRYELELVDERDTVLVNAMAYDADCADRIAVEVEEEDVERADAWDVAYLLITALRYGWQRRVVIAYDEERGDYRLVARNRAGHYTHILDVRLSGDEEGDDSDVELEETV